MDPAKQLNDGTGSGKMTHPYETPANFRQAMEFQHKKEEEKLQTFWTNQLQQANQTTNFKKHNIPLARIKKIMKADEDVHMISAEVPVIFAKACEMFISELTMRSWNYTEENKRRTLQKNDITAAISKTNVFDFLVDIVPTDEPKEDGIEVNKPTYPYYYAQTHPYYYAQPQPQPHGIGSSVMTMGMPTDQAACYVPQDFCPSMTYTQGHVPQKNENKSDRW